MSFGWNAILYHIILIVFDLVRIVEQSPDKVEPSPDDSNHIIGVNWSTLCLHVTNKQRVLMHGHQGWNVRHGLCHIDMIYVYIWVVYSICLFCCCPACRTTLIATRFWVVMICPIIKCLTVLEFSFILFDLCLFITIFNFILNYVPIVTFWIFTYHKIWILLIIFCFIWSYWIIYFLTCLEVFWSVVS